MLHESCQGQQQHKLTSLPCRLHSSLVPSACQVLTLPTFPTSVMGTVVNKRAKYSYLRLVQNSEKLTYRCAGPAGRVSTMRNACQCLLAAIAPCSTTALAVFLQPQSGLTTGT
jgi:hypothetical protein